MLSGGVFVETANLPSSDGLEIFSDCEVALQFVNETFTVAARVVHVSPAGVAVEFVDFGPALRERIATLLATSSSEQPADVSDELDQSEPHADDEPVAERAIKAPAHERLRNLSVAEQIKLALKADTAERILLERIYGKGVWEPLLRNPRITPPEVARIAKMGSLPRPLLEVIVSNGAWLGVPEVRRSLLSNPRLSTDVVPRILRLMPKHELKLVPTQTAYASGIREHARRMLKDG
jgi:hypothetical protein